MFVKIQSIVHYKFDTYALFHSLVELKQIKEFFEKDISQLKGESAGLAPSAPFQHLSTFSAPSQHLSTFSAPLDVEGSTVLIRIEHHFSLL